MAVSLQDVCRYARVHATFIQGGTASTSAGIVGDRNIAALAYNKPGSLGRGHMLLEFASGHNDLALAAAVFGMTIIEKLNIFQNEADMAALLHSLRVGTSRELRVSSAEAIRIVTDATVLPCQCNLRDHAGERTGGDGGSSAQGRRWGGRGGEFSSGRGSPRSLGARPSIFKPPRSSGSHARTRNCSLTLTDLSNEEIEKSWIFITIPSFSSSESSENTGDARDDAVFGLSATSGDGSCSSSSSDEESSASSSSTCDSETDPTSDDSTFATSVSSSCEGSSFESSASSTSSESDCSTTESRDSTLGSKSGSFSEDTSSSSSDSSCSTVLKCPSDDTSTE